MKCLIVTAHPLENSLCAHLTSEIIAHLEANGHEIIVKNLYEEGFEPRLTVAERQSYYADDYDTGNLSSDIEQLQQAEMLVLVFPTWWFGFPAILKGWFDRVWAPGYAYKHAADNTAIIPNLSRLKQLNVVTTLGSPWWVDWLVMWRPISRILRHAIVGTCVKNCKLRSFSLYSSETLDDARVEAFVSKIRQKIS